MNIYFVTCRLSSVVSTGWLDAGCVFWCDWTDIQFGPIFGFSGTGCCAVNTNYVNRIGRPDWAKVGGPEFLNEVSKTVMLCWDVAWLAICYSRWVWRQNAICVALCLMNLVLIYPSGTMDGYMLYVSIHIKSLSVFKDWSLLPKLVFVIDRWYYD